MSVKIFKMILQVMKNSCKGLASTPLSHHDVALPTPKRSLSGIEEAINQTSIAYKLT
jgi:hypothetical protein